MVDRYFASFVVLGIQNCHVYACYQLKIATILRYFFPSLHDAVPNIQWYHASKENFSHRK